jgi:hypothetical protein
MTATDRRQGNRTDDETEIWKSLKITEHWQLKTEQGTDSTEQQRINRLDRHEMPPNQGRDQVPALTLLPWGKVRARARQPRYSLEIASQLPAADSGLESNFGFFGITKIGFIPDPEFSSCLTAVCHVNGNLCRYRTRTTITQHTAEQRKANHGQKHHQVHPSWDSLLKSLLSGGGCQAHVLCFGALARLWMCKAAHCSCPSPE